MRTADQLVGGPEGERIRAEDFADILPSAVIQPPAPPDWKRSLAAAMDELERSLILEGLEDCRGNKLEAARRLGLSCTNLYAKLRKHGTASHSDN
ncbi:DNA-binding NtrC family response regulator [Azospirillum melinis]|nr:DNA-binding NtrC family response regulator [Azospirillum melinis]